MKISNYDEYKYDYSSYWSEREYENLAEGNHIKKELRDSNGDWFIDVGGSFGRLLPHYHSKFANSVIVDYSLLTLQKNAEDIKGRFPNTILISANAYKLPFKNSSFDSGLMVRVLHHIESPEDYFTEIARVLNGKDIYIQEFANKMHFKAVIKNLFKFNFSFFSQSPYQQPSVGNYEGSNGKETVFYNFHPRFISKLMRSTGFELVRKQGVSFLRIPFLKRIVSPRFMNLFETILQLLFRGIYFTPSIFYTTRLAKKSQIDQTDLVSRRIEDILACPSCKSDLKFEDSKCICAQCGKSYLKEGNVWDFRIQ